MILARKNRALRRSDIFGIRTNNSVIHVLLEDVGAPSRRAAEDNEIDHMLGFKT